MSRLRTELLTLGYVIIGTAVGGAAGFGVAWAEMAYSIRANPNDPSAGSVGIVVLITFPIGAFAGFYIALMLRMRHLRHRKTETDRGFEVVSKTKNRPQNSD